MPNHWDDSFGPAPSETLAAQASQCPNCYRSYGSKAHQHFCVNRDSLCKNENGVNGKHRHHFFFESPSGGSTVDGKCDCGETQTLLASGFQTESWRDRRDRAKKLGTGIF